MSGATPRPRCDERVSGEGAWGGFHTHQCLRKSVVERNGKHFCKQHDPTEIDRKQKERSKEWETKWDRERKQAEYNRKAVNLHDRMVEMLKRLEWIGVGVLLNCPICGEQNPRVHISGISFHGIHTPDCALAQLLKEAEV